MTAPHSTSTGTPTPKPADRPVLVLGATGGQGHAVAQALLAREVPVRALVRAATSPSARDLSDRGVELTQGSFTDISSLRAAMRGVSAVFALTTPFEDGPDAEVTQGMTIIAAAMQATVPYLVYSSVAGALNETGVPHFESKAQIERELQHREVPHAVVAPTYFYDNMLGQLATLNSGLISLPLPADRPLQQVDRATFGQITAEVLCAPGTWTGRRVDIAADAPTGEEMARSLTHITGAPIRYQPIHLADVHADNDDMGAMWNFLSDTGYRVDIAGLRRTFPAAEYTPFDRWAAAQLGGNPVSPHPPREKAAMFIDTEISRRRSVRCSGPRTGTP